MSGGSWRYIYREFEDVADRLKESDAPERRVLGDLIELIARAMHDIEWVDSGDFRRGDEVAAIRACLAPGAELAVLIEDAHRAADALADALARAEEGS